MVFTNTKIPIGALELREPSHRVAEIEKLNETLTCHFNFTPDTVPFSVPLPILWPTRDVEIKNFTALMACLPKPHSAVTEAGNFERYMDEIAGHPETSNMVAVE